MAESALTILTFIVMVGILLVSLIPFIPGPILMWLASVVYAFATDFSPVSIPVLIVITLIMILGSTTDWWLPLLGMKTSGMSCLGTVGSIVGGIIGTFVIPIPICGTLIGAVMGALLFEFMRAGDRQKAARAGYVAMETFFIGMGVEVAASLLIFGVFILAVWLG